MAKQRRSGFKAPKNYEPQRGKKRRTSEPGRADRGEKPGGTGGQAQGAGRGASGANQHRAQESRGYREGAPAQRTTSRDRDLAKTHHAKRQLRKERAHEERSAPPSQGDVVAKLTATKTTVQDVGDSTFASLGLGGNIVRALSEQGAEAPFPIQFATIPDIIDGRDVLGRGKTGSGKTIAFGSALVERLLILKARGAFATDTKPKAEKLKRGERSKKPARQGRNPKALILAPTRELALQLDATIQPIARSVGFYTAQLVGGVPIDPQLHALERGADIIIGTPGRVQDLVTRRKLDLREVVVSVIDEADHMCDLGFLEPVQLLLRQTVRGGQRLLFSATLDQQVGKLVNEFLRDAVAHEVVEDAQDARSVEHRVFVVMREHKDDVLLQLARLPGSIMVFCRTRAYAATLAERFVANGVSAVPLHGDLSQSKREQNLAKFSSGKARVLVATDVAARGIHVDNVDLVVQADPADDYKLYLHRSGRTARAGKSGRVITLIPRTRQQRTREMLENAEIIPVYFGDFVPGDTATVKQ